MNNIVLHIALILVLINTIHIQSQNDSNSEKHKKAVMIFSTNIFHNIKTEDAKAVTLLLVNHIKKSYKLDFDFEVNTLDAINDIEALAKSDFDYIIITSEEYLALKNKIPLEPFFTTISDGHIGYRYYLVVNKNSNITDVSQLKGESINVLSQQNQKTPMMWLDKVLKNKKLANHNKFFKAVSFDNKASNVLLPVIFNKVKACIITEPSYNLLAELNPSIKDKTIILATSDYLLLGLGCLNFNKKETNAYKVLKDIIPKLHENEYGNQFLKLFYADKSVLYKEEYLQNFIKLYK